MMLWVMLLITAALMAISIVSLPILGVLNKSQNGKFKTTSNTMKTLFLISSLAIICQLILLGEAAPWGVISALSTMGATGYLFCFYLLGSISSPIIISSLLKRPDPRTNGSHKVNAFNVYRLGGLLPATIAFLGDYLKGFIGIILFEFILLKIGFANPYLSSITALIVIVLGDMFPLFTKFKGGNGIATALGGITAIVCDVLFLISISLAVTS